jgi:uncharacterized protein (DUF2267 family)
LASTRATLETLGERLGDNEPENLATQLPEELVQVQPLTAVVLAGADLPGAVYQVHTVFEVLDEAVSNGETDDIRQQLPEDYQRIIDSGA